MAKTRQEIASLGGTAVYKKYGSSYMAAIGRKGYLVMKAKYDVVPYGTSDFAIVSKKTGKILALMSGKKLQSEE